ncbi:MAG: hypothetical protein SFX73_40355 [Kofleriaceae bacterium]|nr:hypothetical protein [Kofleriaceae bacterium]
MPRHFWLACLSLVAGCIEPEVEPDIENDSSEIRTRLYEVMPVCDRELVVREKAKSMALLYCATGSIQGAGTAPPPTYPGYTRLVITQHGRGGNAKKYFETMSSIAAEYRERTFVIAPQLLNMGEVLEDYDGTVGFVSGWHFQWGSRWPLGGLSSTSNGEPLARSSFEMHDQVLAAAVPLLPDLEEIVIVGQSAGGQLVNRYAATNQVGFPAGVNVRYIPMNPQSWLYLSDERPFPELALAGGDIAPDEPGPVHLPTVCPHYNDYWTGLDKLDWGYFTANGITPNDVIAQFKSRKVINMVGENDIENPDPVFDCRYAVQGKNRNERAKAYYAHVMAFYAPIAANHSFFEVPGVAHGHEKMFDSPCGRRWIFDDLAQVCN